MNAFGVEIRSYNDLLEALVARKNEIGLSNETLEEIAGVTRGHVDKVFGPSREKRMGWMLFGLMLPSLGVKLRLELDGPQAQLMQARWERRNEKQIRVRSPEINKLLLEHAKLEVFSELNRRRHLMLPRSIRSKIARKAARARWRKRRSKRNGSTSKGIRTRVVRSSNSNLS